LSSKEVEKSDLQGRLDDLEIAYMQLQATNEDILDSYKHKDNELIRTLRSKAESLEDEVTQCRAHVEIFQMERDEAMESKKRAENEAIESKKGIEDDFKRRLNETTTYFEAQIKAMQSAHEIECEKIRDVNQKLIEECKEEVTANLAALQAKMDETKEEYHDQVATVAELRSQHAEVLKRELQNSNEHYIDIVTELGTAQASVENLKELVESLYRDLATANDDCRGLEEARKEIKALHDSLSREQTRCESFFERTTRLEANIEDKSAAIFKSESSISVMHAEVEELKAKKGDFESQTVQLLSATKEIASLQDIATDAKAKLSEMTGRCKQEQAENDRHEKALEALIKEEHVLRTAMAEKQRQLDSLTAVNADLVEDVNTMRQHFASTDTTIEAQRKALVETQSELSAAQALAQRLADESAKATLDAAESREWYVAHICLYRDCTAIACRL
jgi:chromosome segregation ATPase